MTSSARPASGCSASSKAQPAPPTPTPRAFPTLADPRHADAYSPLWDAQLGLWTPKAVSEGLNTRQIDEVQVFNLAATRPDLLTGVNPATGQPEPYGSVGVDINCAVIGFTASAPTANLAQPVPGSQFPPR